MDLSYIQEGDRLKINGKSYEALSIAHEADIAKPPEYQIRSFLAVYLHEENSKQLHPTHLLQYYEDTRELFLLTIKQDTPPIGIEKTKTRGNIISFHNKIGLNLNDVQISSIKRLNQKVFRQLDTLTEKELDILAGLLGVGINQPIDEPPLDREEKVIILATEPEKNLEQALRQLQKRTPKRRIRTCELCTEKYYSQIDGKEVCKHHFFDIYFKTRDEECIKAEFQSEMEYVQKSKLPKQVKEWLKEVKKRYPKLYDNLMG